MQLLKHRSFDWTFIRVVGQEDSIREMLTDRWAAVHLFDLIQYIELTREFHSTFRHTLTDFAQPHAVSFALGRHTYEMYVPEFAVATRFTPSRFRLRPLLNNSEHPGLTLAVYQ